MNMQEQYAAAARTFRTHCLKEGTVRVGWETFKIGLRKYVPNGTGPHGTNAAWVLNDLLLDVVKNDPKLKSFILEAP